MLVQKRPRFGQGIGKLNSQSRQRAKTGTEKENPQSETKHNSLNNESLVNKDYEHQNSSKEFLCFLGISDSSKSFPIFHEVLLGDKTCKAFIDPGCHKSLVNSIIFQLIPKHFIKRIEPTLAKIKPLNSQSVGAQAKATISIQISDGIEKQAKEWEFLVVQDLDFELIIGWDLLHNLGTQLDMTNNQMRFKSSNSDKCIGQSYGSVILPKAVSLPPRCLKVAEIALRSIDGNMVPHGCTVLIEPGEGMEGYINASANIVRNDKSIIVIFNNSEEPMFLPRRTIIGTFQEIEDNLITAFKAEEINEYSDNKILLPTLGDMEFISQFKLSHLNNRQEIKSELIALLKEFREVFSTHCYDVGKNSLMEYRVDIDKTKPVPQPHSFNLPLKMQELLQEHILGMTRGGIIRPERSEFCSSIFLVGKQKDGEILPRNEWTMETSRIVFDCRTINAVVKDSAWPIRKFKMFYMN